MKYSKRSIMHTAWNLFRKGVETFASALRMAWANAKAAAAAKTAAEVTEETHTRAGCREPGYEVIHESKALYRAILADPTTKTGSRTACYFGMSQVLPIPAEA